MNTHPSRLGLDRVAAGAEAPEIEGHIATCSRCAHRLAELRAEDAAFLIRRPRAPEVTRQHEPRRWNAWPLAVAAGLAAAAAVYVLPLPNSSVERAKGNTSVEILLSREGVSRSLEDEALRPGDTILFRPRTGARYLLVVGVEASGRVQALVADQGQSLGIDPGKIAPIGVRLDAYAGPERWIAITSDTPISVDRALDVLRERYRGLPTQKQNTIDVGPLDLAGDETQWLLRKERP